MSSDSPKIFNARARHAKLRRAAPKFARHDFIHRKVADDIVDRLESILTRFERVLVCGPGAALVAEAMTTAADVGTITVFDDLTDDTASHFTSLPHEDGAFDAVVSSMALHAVDDLPGALVEARRVLRPDGLFLGTFPAERTLFELREALRTAEAVITGKVGPRIFPFVAVKDGGSLLQAAGFALPVADVSRLTVDYPDPARLFEDLRGTGETNILREGPKGALRRDVLAATLSVYSERFATPGGRIPATIELLTLTGWKPHPSQPKPKAPGSATMSLADAVRQS